MQLIQFFFLIFSIILARYLALVARQRVAGLMTSAHLKRYKSVTVQALMKNWNLWSCYQNAMPQI